MADMLTRYAAKLPQLAENPVLPERLRRRLTGTELSPVDDGAAIAQRLEAAGEQRNWFEQTADSVGQRQEGLPDLAMGLGNLITGDKEAAVARLGRYQANEELARSLGPAAQDFNEIEDFGSGASVIGYQFAKMVPDMIAGGVGGLLGKQAVKLGAKKILSGAVARELAGNAGIQSLKTGAAEKAVRETIKTSAYKELGNRAAERAAKKEARAAAEGMFERQIETTAGKLAAGNPIMKPLGNVGFAVGATAGSVPSNLQDQGQFMAENADTMSQGDAWKLLAGTTAAASTDFLPLMGFMGRFSKQGVDAARSADKFGKRLLKATGGQFLAEGGQEAIQAVITRSSQKWVDENVEMLSDEALADYGMNFIAGGIMGGVMGASGEVGTTSVRKAGDFFRNTYTKLETARVNREKARAAGADPNAPPVDPGIDPSAPTESSKNAAAAAVQSGRTINPIAAKALDAPGDDFQAQVNFSKKVDSSIMDITDRAKRYAAGDVGAIIPIGADVRRLTPGDAFARIAGGVALTGTQDIQDTPEMRAGLQSLGLAFKHGFDSDLVTDEDRARIEDLQDYVAEPERVSQLLSMRAERPTDYAAALAGIDAQIAAEDDATQAQTERSTGAPGQRDVFVMESGRTAPSDSDRGAPNILGPAGEFFTGKGIQTGKQALAGNTAGNTADGEAATFKGARPSAVLLRPEYQAPLQAFLKGLEPAQQAAASKAYTDLAEAAQKVGELSTELPIFRQPAEEALAKIEARPDVQRLMQRLRETVTSAADQTAAAKTRAIFPAQGDGSAMRARVADGGKYVKNDARKFASLYAGSRDGSHAVDIGSLYVSLAHTEDMLEASKPHERMAVVVGHMLTNRAFNVDRSAVPWGKVLTLKTGEKLRIPPEKKTLQYLQDAHPDKYAALKQRVAEFERGEQIPAPYTVTAAEIARDAEKDEADGDELKTNQPRSITTEPVTENSGFVQGEGSITSAVAKAAQTLRKEIVAMRRIGWDKIQEQLDAIGTPTATMIRRAPSNGKNLVEILERGNVLKTMTYEALMRKAPLLLDPARPKAFIQASNGAFIKTIDIPTVKDAIEFAKDVLTKNIDAQLTERNQNIEARKINAMSDEALIAEFNAIRTGKYAKMSRVLEARTQDDKNFDDGATEYRDDKYTERNRKPLSQDEAAAELAERKAKAAVPPAPRKKGKRAVLTNAPDLPLATMSPEKTPSSKPAKAARLTAGQAEQAAYDRMRTEKNAYNTGKNAGVVAYDASAKPTELADVLLAKRARLDKLKAKYEKTKTKKARAKLEDTIAELNDDIDSIEKSMEASGEKVVPRIAVSKNYDPKLRDPNDKPKALSRDRMMDGTKPKTKVTPRERAAMRKAGVAAPDRAPKIPQSGPIARKPESARVVTVKAAPQRTKQTEARMAARRVRTDAKQQSRKGEAFVSETIDNIYAAERKQRLKALEAKYKKTKPSEMNDPKVKASVSASWSQKPITVTDHKANVAKFVKDLTSLVGAKSAQALIKSGVITFVTRDNLPPFASQVHHTVQAFEYKGRIYVLADTDPGNASGVLLHESLHAFGKQALGEDWAPLMASLAELAGLDAPTQRDDAPAASQFSAKLGIPKAEASIFDTALATLPADVLSNIKTGNWYSDADRIRATYSFAEGVLQEKLRTGISATAFADIVESFLGDASDLLEYEYDADDVAIGYKNDKEVERLTFMGTYIMHKSMNGYKNPDAVPRAISVTALKLADGIMAEQPSLSMVNAYNQAANLMFHQFVAHTDSKGGVWRKVDRLKNEPLAEQKMRVAAVQANSACGWCIKNDYHAGVYLNRGDIWLYSTRDGAPSVAIRFELNSESNGIAEIQGPQNDRTLSDEQQRVVAELISAGLIKKTAVRDYVDGEAEDKNELSLLRKEATLTEAEQKQEDFEAKKNRVKFRYNEMRRADDTKPADWRVFAIRTFFAVLDEMIAVAPEYNAFEALRNTAQYDEQLRKLAILTQLRDARKEARQNWGEADAALQKAQMNRRQGLISEASFAAVEKYNAAAKWTLQEAERKSDAYAQKQGFRDASKAFVGMGFALDEQLDAHMAKIESAVRSDPAYAFLKPETVTEAEAEAWAENGGRVRYNEDGEPELIPFSVKGSAATGKDWIAQGKARVLAAGVKPGMQAEEFAAYAIENYESAPASVKKWVDGFLAKLKIAVAKLLRTLKVAPKFRVAILKDPAVLREIALQGLKTAGQRSMNAGVMPATARRTESAAFANSRREFNTRKKGSNAPAYALGSAKDKAVSAAAMETLANEFDAGTINTLAEAGLIRVNTAAQLHATDGGDYSNVGGFAIAGRVTLVADYVADTTAMKATMAHEAVHAWLPTILGAKKYSALIQALFHDSAKAMREYRAEHGKLATYADMLDNAGWKALAYEAAHTRTNFYDINDRQAIDEVLAYHVSDTIEANAKKGVVHSLVSRMKNRVKLALFKAVADDDSKFSQAVIKAISDPNFLVYMAEQAVFDMARKLQKMEAEFGGDLEAAGNATRRETDQIRNEHIANLNWDEYFTASEMPHHFTYPAKPISVGVAFSKKLPSDKPPTPPKKTTRKAKLGTPKKVVDMDLKEFSEYTDKHLTDVHRQALYDIVHSVGGYGASIRDSDSETLSAEDGYHKTMFVALSEYLAGNLKSDPNTQQFTDYFDRLKGRMGVFTTNDLALKILEDMKDGTMERTIDSMLPYQPEIDIRTKQSTLGSFVDELRKIGAGANRIYTSFIKNEYDQAKNSGIPAWYDLLNAIQPRSGLRLTIDPKTGKANDGVTNAMAHATGAWIKKLNAAGAGLTAAQESNVMRELYYNLEKPRASTLNAKEKEAFHAIRAVYKEMGEYGLEVGMFKGEKGSSRLRRNFTPVLFDIGGNVELHKAKLKNMFYQLDKNGKYKYVKLLDNLYEQLNPTLPGKTPQTFDNLNSKMQTAFVDKMVDNAFFDANDLMLENQMGKRFKFDAPRVWQEVYDQAKASGDNTDLDTLVSTLEPSLVEHGVRYVETLVAKVEEKRYFPDGPAPYVTKMAAQGATNEQINKALRAYDNAFGRFTFATLGPNGEKGSPTIAAISESLAKKMHSRKTLRVMQNVGAWQNLRLLPLAVLSSLVDPAGIIVRNGGDLSAGITAFKNAMASMWSPETREALLAAANDIGYAAELEAAAALDANAGTGSRTPWARKVNSAVFKYNGMQALTKYTRLVAIQAGHAFLVRQQLAARGSDPKARATALRYFEELGLKVDDVRAGTVKKGPLAGQPTVLLDSPSQARSANKGRREADARVKAALIKFTDEAILRPTGLQTPGWHNDPYTKLITQYKAFTYAIYEQITRRIATELHNENYGVLNAALAYLPVIIMAELLREFIQYGAKGNPNRADWGGAEYLGMATVKTGLLGPGTDLTSGIATDMQRGNIPGKSFAGPTAGTLSDISKSASGERAWGTTIESLAPASALWKHWNDGNNAGQNNNSASGSIMEFKTKVANQEPGA